MKDTRERLLEAALDLFAEHGFEGVTVRDLSAKAGVNLQAIGYHFGDKLGLYRTLVEMAMEGARSVQEKLREESHGLTPDEQLRHYVCLYLPLIAASESPRIQKLQRVMRHEFNTPSPLAKRFIERIIVPRLLYLSEIIAGILECPADDPRVRTCTLSVQAQCMYYAREPVRKMLPPAWRVESKELPSIAEHVAAISLAGIKALK